MYFFFASRPNKKQGAPTVSVRNQTPAAYPGSPLHLSVEFCANPPAYAARWLHGDRVYTPGNQYGNDVLAYGVIVSHFQVFALYTVYLVVVALLLLSRVQFGWY